MRADRLSIVKFLDEIKLELLNDGISKIGLFGSYARDENNVYSDIDIAIKKADDYLNTRSSYDYFDEITKIKNLIRNKFHKNIDIFDVDSNSSMQDQILRDIIYV